MACDLDFLGDVLLHANNSNHEAIIDSSCSLAILCWGSTENGMQPTPRY